MPINKFLSWTKWATEPFRGPNKKIHQAGQGLKKDKANKIHTPAGGVSVKKEGEKKN